MTGILISSRLTALVELSLTVPITNSLAFLFTVLGEWYVEKKVIGRGIFFAEELCSLEALILCCVVDTWIGMALSLCGIALCVQSKI
jgi:hypothetical protein